MEHVILKYKCATQRLLKREQSPATKKIKAQLNKGVLFVEPALESSATLLRRTLQLMATWQPGNMNQVPQA